MVTVEIQDMENRLFRDENNAICNIEFVKPNDGKPLRLL